ncbi:MAG: DUF6428 family protein [Bacteroidota bacterium]
MKTKQFLNLLEQHSDKDLVFFYENEKSVQGGYHITEIKKVSIDAVDCGGRPSEDQQMVVQLWVPEGSAPEAYMKSGKALSIFKKVDSVKPLFLDSEIFFEYGDQTVKTSNHAVKSIKVGGEEMKVMMEVPPTVCKPRLELAALADSCCTTSGCC